jgi:hypothetical protein
MRIAFKPLRNETDLPTVLQLDQEPVNGNDRLLEEPLILIAADLLPLLA